MASRESTPRSRSRSSTDSSGSSDTTMLDAPPLPLGPPVRPRPASHTNPSVTAAPSPKDPSFSLLLSLPRELRDRVYFFALTSPFPFLWPADRDPGKPKHNVALGLLSVSRRVHQEAAPILYSSNKFLFTHPSDCNIFRIVASPVHSAQINEVCFRIREKDLRLWTTYLGSKTAERSLKADLPKLKSLWIFLRCGNVGLPGVLGHIGGHGVAPHGLPPAIAAQVQAVQNVVGQQVQAIHQQYQNLQQAAQTLLLQNQQQQLPPLQVNPPANGGQPLNQAMPPPPPPAPPMPFPAFAQTFQGNQNANGPVQAQQNPNPNPVQPGPHNQLTQQLLAQAPHLPQQAHQQHPPQGHPPPHHHHPPLYTHFLRWERELGLENLCLSLQETRPQDSECKIVCIMRLPRLEVQRLTRLYPEELSVDRTGDARTRFRRLHGVEVSLEISGVDLVG